MPAQGAVPAVHGAEATGAAGRGEHQHAVPVPAQPLLPHAPLRPGRHSGQPGRQRAHLQRLLPATGLTCVSEGTVNVEHTPVNIYNLVQRSSEWKRKTKRTDTQRI